MRAPGSMPMNCAIAVPVLLCAAADSAARARIRNGIAPRVRIQATALAIMAFAPTGRSRTCLMLCASLPPPSRDRRPAACSCPSPPPPSLDDRELADARAHRAAVHLIDVETRSDVEVVLGSQVPRHHPGGRAVLVQCLHQLPPHGVDADRAFLGQVPEL